MNFVGDYRVGETLLAESASVIALCDPPVPPVEAGATAAPTKELAPDETHKGLSLPSISNMFSRSRTPSPEPVLTPLPPPLVPRRMVILLIGLKPHRKLWTLSARPGESVINYILFNGCPSFVVPAKVGAPLIAWDGLTLEQLWKVELPPEDEQRSPTGKFEGIVDVIFEYVDFCVDWDRVKVNISPSQDESMDKRAGDEGEATVTEALKLDGEAKEVRLSPVKAGLKDAITLLVASAIRSKESKAVVKEVDPERSGIALWRIP